MRRLGRSTLNALTALSLPICVAAAGFWVRSYWRWDEVAWRNSNGIQWLQAQRGSVEVGGIVAPSPAGPRESFGLRFRHDQSMMPLIGLKLAGPEPGERRTDIEWHGFEWYSSQSAGGGLFQFAALIPFWAVTAAAALLPVARLIRRTRRRWRAGGDGRPSRCRSCLYDLTGNVSGICPECGAAIRPKVGAAG